MRDSFLFFFSELQNIQIYIGVLWRMCPQGVKLYVYAHVYVHEPGYCVTCCIPASIHSRRIDVFLPCKILLGRSPPPSTLEPFTDGAMRSKKDAPPRPSTRQLTCAGTPYTCTECKTSLFSVNEWRPVRLGARDRWTRAGGSELIARQLGDEA